MTWVPARGVGAFTWRGCLRVEACGARACNFQRTYMTTVATAVDVSFPFVDFTGIVALPVLCVPSGFPRYVLSCCEAFNVV